MFKAASLPLRQTLKCFAYGNSIYREKDLRDDGGVLQRPRGEGSRPEAQERRRADGKVPLWRIDEKKRDSKDGRYNLSAINKV